ncbi:MAG TPA: hypothetical protein VGL38_14785 [bacterium]|jgi:hypothetical protein
MNPIDNIPPDIVQACQSIAQCHREVTAWGNEIEKVLRRMEQDQRLILGGDYVDHGSPQPAARLHIAVDFAELIRLAFPTLDKERGAGAGVDKVSERHGQMVLFFGLSAEFYPLVMLPPHAEEYRHFVKDLPNFVQRRVNVEFELLRHQLNDLFRSAALPEDAGPQGGQINDQDFQAIVRKLEQEYPNLAMLMSGTFSAGVHLLQSLFGTSFLTPRVTTRLEDRLPSEVIRTVTCHFPPPKTTADEEVSRQAPSIPKKSRLLPSGRPAPVDLPGPADVGSDPFWYTRCVDERRREFRDRSDANDAVALTWVERLNHDLYRRTQSEQPEAPRDILLFLSNSPALVRALTRAESISADTSHVCVPGLQVNVASIDALKALVVDLRHPQDSTNPMVYFFRQLDTFRLFTTIRNQNILSLTARALDPQKRGDVLAKVIQLRQDYAVFSENSKLMAEIARDFGAGGSLDENASYYSMSASEEGRNAIHALSRAVERLDHRRKQMKAGFDFAGSLAPSDMAPLFPDLSFGKERKEERRFAELIAFLRDRKRGFDQFQRFVQGELADFRFRWTALRLQSEAIETIESGKPDYVLRFGSLPYYVTLRDCSLGLAKDLVQVIDLCNRDVLPGQVSSIGRLLLDFSKRLHDDCSEFYWLDQAAPAAAQLERKLIFLQLMFVDENYRDIVRIVDAMDISYLGNEVTEASRDDIDLLLRELCLLRIEAAVLDYSKTMDAPDVHPKVRAKAARNMRKTVDEAVDFYDLHARIAPDFRPYRFLHAAVVGTLQLLDLAPGEYFHGELERSILTNRCRIVAEGATADLRLSDTQDLPATRLIGQRPLWEAATNNLIYWLAKSGTRDNVFEAHRIMQEHIERNGNEYPRRESFKHTCGLVHYEMWMMLRHDASQTDVAALHRQAATDLLDKVVQITKPGSFVHVDCITRLAKLRPGTPAPVKGSAA